MKKAILLQIVLILSTISAQAQENWKDSRFSWRAGLSVSLSTYMQNDYGGEGPTYDVGLAERYGRYHGKVYSFFPVSADINYKLFKFLDLSAGLSWIPMWSDVYDSYDATEGHTVFANSFILMPSIRIRYFTEGKGFIYSSAGFGVGFHFNRSDSEMIGEDHWWYHNDYILDKGKNSITKQLEIVLLGIKYGPVFWEGGLGSKFWGYGSRFGVEFNF